MQFADPRNDVAFKKIFGDETKKEILISLLNAILDFQGAKTIVDLQILNPYQVPKIEELKETILDIKARNTNGEEFIVEMQKKDLNDFAKRSLYYTSKAYVSQINKGDDYARLKKVYFIGILNFDMFEGASFISRHLILNKETLKHEIEDFEFTFIELNKFDKKLDELESVFEKWIFFIKNAANFTLIPKEFQSQKEFQEAFEIATQYKWDKKEMEIYDYIEMKERDEKNALNKAVTKAIKQGEAIGMEKGMEKGIEKGIEKAKLEIAKNLLDVLDNETLALKTGLSIAKIEELRL